jgi:hypothetical protein
MKRLLLAIGLLFLAGAARAQTMNALVVSNCNGQTYTAGFPYPVTQTPAGLLCGGVTITSGAVTANQGTPNGGGGNAWPVTDAGVLAAVEAAVPAGTNTIGNVNVVTNNASTGIIQATASQVISSTGAGGPTQLIALSGSTKIYITNYHIVFSGAGTFAWVTGTGSNCGSNTAYLTGAASHPMSFAANGGINAGGGLGPIIITPAGYALCYITTGAVDISGSVAYAQF